MKKQLVDLLRELISWIEDSKNPRHAYVDLAPTDNADKSGIYTDALCQATKNPNVFNIALTGPYGSGKSSIIKTFLRTYNKGRRSKRSVLQISLAAFLPEAEAASGGVSKQEIERSILQQMLYGADANKLPLSRFKRIQSPRWWAPSISLFAIIGAAACWHLAQHSDAIFSGAFFLPFHQTNWLNIGSFTIALIFIWSFIHFIYLSSLGFSIKNISLKDVEITPQNATEESILNRHLDEIIYIFSSLRGMILL